ncbi:MAG: hypothetical protein AB7T08_12860 [Hyphomonadaceae bacterium]
MTNTQLPTTDSLSFWDAVKSIGWIPLLLMGVGGLSIIDILEKAVFHDLSLMTPFQMALIGYQRIATVAGLIFEPLLQPAIDWLSAVVGWSIQLPPSWRSVFILGLIIVASISRAFWRAGLHSLAAQLFLSGGFGALIGAAAAATAASVNTWWAHGLAAALPAASIFMSIAVSVAVRDLIRGDAPGAVRVLLRVTRVTTLIAIGVFVLGSGLFFVLVEGAGAGILALSLLIAAFGLFRLRRALSEADRLGARIGLTVLGGFAAAGVILIANWVTSALS